MSCCNLPEDHEGECRPLSRHAQALLLAFRDGRPVFEAHALRSVPVMDTPLSLREGPPVAAALDELHASNLIEPWRPTKGSDPAKPHPQLPLRRYWPEGRIWARCR